MTIPVKRGDLTGREVIREQTLFHVEDGTLALHYFRADVVDCESGEVVGHLAVVEEIRIPLAKIQWLAKPQRKGGA